MKQLLNSIKLIGSRYQAKVGITRRGCYKTNTNKKKKKKKKTSYTSFQICDLET